MILLKKSKVIVDDMRNNMNWSLHPKGQALAYINEAVKAAQKDAVEKTLELIKKNYEHLEFNNLMLRTKDELFNQIEKT